VTRAFISPKPKKISNFPNYLQKTELNSKTGFCDKMIAKLLEAHSGVTPVTEPFVTDF